MESRISVEGGLGFTFEGGVECRISGEFSGAEGGALPILW